MKGRILTEDQRPLQGAHVYLDKIDAPVLTDSVGRYKVRAALHPGCHRLHIALVGYDHVLWHFAVRDNSSIDLGEAIMHAEAVELPAQFYATCRMPIDRSESSLGWGIDTVRFEP